MNWGFNITDEQKKQLVQLLISSIVTFVVAALGILGYNLVIVQPAEKLQEARYAQLRNELGFEDSAPDQVGALEQTGGVGLVCKSSSKACLQSWYGRDLVGYSNAGSTQMWKIEGTDGSITHKGFEVWTPSTGITVTNGAAFTPTATYQPIRAAGNVTPTVTAGFATGTILRLVNTSNTSILIQDTGTMMLTGDLTLGQYDSLALISDGTNWIEVATSNN